MNSQEIANMTPLHQIDHPYYISATDDDETMFETWDDFLDEWKDAIDDFNLVYRFDAYPINDYYGGGDLSGSGATHYIKIAFIHQRKSRLVVVSVGYTHDDEPRIREYLRSKYDYLLKLWTPFSPSELVLNKEDES